MLSPEGARCLAATYHELRAGTARPFHEAETLETATFTDLLQELIDRGQEVACVDIYKGWLEIDTFEDYRRAWAKIQ